MLVNERGQTYQTSLLIFVGCVSILKLDKVLQQIRQNFR
jgi:hypothetical protein